MPYNHSINLFPPLRRSPHLSLVDMGSFSGTTQTSDEQHRPVSIDPQQVDTGAHLDASLQMPLDPNESLRIR